MRRIGTVAAMLALPVLLVAACRTTTQPVGAPPAAQPTTTAPHTPTTTASRPTSGPPSTATVDQGLPDNGPSGVLAALTTQHFTDHDRVVFQFHGHTAPKPIIGYAGRINADPSDKPVALLGTTFLAVVFHGARLDTAPAETDPSKVVRYSGPTRLTPRYPLLQQLAVSGDYEAVLSFGLGLTAVAGLSESAPPGQGRVILDLWRTAPHNLLWPSTSVTQAGWFQRLADDGNHLWMLNAADVASRYTHNVLGWPRGTVQAINDHVFQISGNPGFCAIITLSQPLGRAHTVWTVAGVIDSTREPYIP